MNEIILVKVSNSNDAEILRQIRNECRSFMTRNTSEISEDQQQNWFKNLDMSLNEPYIVYDVYCGVTFSPIGYGFNRVDMNGNCVLLTGGLIKSHRGLGYGSIIFSRLIQLAKKYDLPIKLEVLKTNTVAYSVYKKLGFRVTGEYDNIITMEYNYDSVI